MREEIIRKRKDLLLRMPEMGTEKGVRWNIEGIGQDFISLCALLKENEIPTTELDLSSNNSIPPPPPQANDCHLYHCFLIYLNIIPEYDCERRAWDGCKLGVEGIIL